MENGTLKFFNEKKGYGFITDQKSGKDIFVHHTGLVDQLQDDDKVTYDLSEDNKGVKAINVKKV